MGGIDDARAHGQRTAAHGVSVEQLQRHAAPDHVDYRVHCPDLVESDLLGVLVVDGAFRDGQKAESLQRARRGPLREIRAFYQGADVPEGPVESAPQGTSRLPGARRRRLPRPAPWRGRRLRRGRAGELVISGSGAPAATRAARVMSPAAPPTGWKWTWVKPVSRLREAGPR